VHFRVQRLQCRQNAYVRREAVASSQIEGTQSSLSQLLMFC
jgi:hypothetical protein